jgi:hypothetical protein
MKTILLLDVDGVLNASKAGWSSAPHSGTAYAMGNGWRIRWAPALVKRLWNLHKSGKIEIVWGTTWCGSTDAIEKLLGLPHFDSYSDSPMSITDKQRAAEAIVDSGSRLVWADDEAIPLFGDLLDKLEASGRVLLIRPKANRGLRPEHMDAIERFIHGV